MPPPGSAASWIQNCQVLFSPSFPISLLGSSHNTLRDNLIDMYELHNRIEDPSYEPIVGDTQPQLYEPMAETEDVLGDHPPAGTGRATSWCAPRYLPRGERPEATSSGAR